MFTQLDQVSGDMFYIHILNEVLAYKIDKIQDVKPDETDTLRIVSGEDYVTLLTCTPYGINDRRLLVRGTRVPYTPDENSRSTSEIPDPPTSDNSLSKCYQSDSRNRCDCTCCYYRFHYCLYNTL